jgi:hypothetical protein
MAPRHSVGTLFRCGPPRTLWRASGLRPVAPRTAAGCRWPGWHTLKCTHAAAASRSTVACSQWLVLRRCDRGPRWLAGEGGAGTDDTIQKAVAAAEAAAHREATTVVDAELVATEFVGVVWPPGTAHPPSCARQARVQARQ